MVLILDWLLGWMQRYFGMIVLNELIWVDGFNTNIQRIHKIDADPRDDFQTELSWIHIQMSSKHNNESRPYQHGSMDCPFRLSYQWSNSLLCTTSIESWYLLIRTSELRFIKTISFMQSLSHWKLNHIKYTSWNTIIYTESWTILGNILIYRIFIWLIDCWINWSINWWIFHLKSSWSGTFIFFRNKQIEKWFWIHSHLNDSCIWLY